MALTLQQVGDIVSKWTTKVVDFHGRRITNASASQTPSDYVIQKELTLSIQVVTALIDGLASKLSQSFQLSNNDILFNKGDVIVGFKGNVLATDGVTKVGWYVGVGDPETVVSAEVGSFYSRTDGGAGTSWYVKESDPGGPTGWIAK